jgi:hypothetical protein
MIEPERKRHLIDHAEIARFVAEMSKLGVSENAIYDYAVRVFVIDLDILSDVLGSDAVRRHARLRSRWRNPASCALTLASARSTCSIRRSNVAHLIHFGLATLSSIPSWLSNLLRYLKLRWSAQYIWRFTRRLISETAVGTATEKPR